MGLCTGYDEIV